MANSLENVTLALHSIQNLEGLRLDMRRNALSYKANVAEHFERVVEVMGRDAAEYLRRLGWQRAIAQDQAKRAKLVDGLQRLNIVISEAAGYLTELENAATALRDAPKTTAAEVTTAADAILAAVSPSDRLWD